MQLRHIRPGSLEWQDAKAEEIEPGTERLTPEEISRLRALSEEHRTASQENKQTPTVVH
jgi:hypothetical protein